jgi:hypothetical protein
MSGDRVTLTYLLVADDAEQHAKHLFSAAQCSELYAALEAALKDASFLLQGALCELWSTFIQCRAIHGRWCIY